MAKPFSTTKIFESLGSDYSAFLDDEIETTELGAKLAQVLVSKLPQGATVFLQGDLGAGKSTLARAMIRALGYQGAVRSPTYTLVERYPTEPMPCCHFDLYRMADPEELEFIGARDDLSAGNLCLIEWPERGIGWLQKPDVEIQLQLNYIKKDSQVIKITRQIDIRWHNSVL